MTGRDAGKLSAFGPRKAMTVQPFPAQPGARAGHHSALQRVWKAALVGSLVGLLAALPLAAIAEPARQLRIEAEGLDGKPYSLAQDRGAIVVVAIWSPESLASRKSIGELQRFANARRSDGLKVMAVSVTRDAAALRSFVAARQLDLPVAMLATHDLGPLPEADLPIVWAFDRDGTLRGVHRGLFRLRQLEQLVEPLSAMPR
jgi:hypothetical protein